MMAKLVSVDQSGATGEEIVLMEVMNWTVVCSVLICLSFSTFTKICRNTQWIVDAVVFVITLSNFNHCNIWHNSVG